MIFSGNFGFYLYYFMFLRVINTLGELDSGLVEVAFLLINTLQMIDFWLKFEIFEILLDRVWGIEEMPKKLSSWCDWL